MKKFLSKMMTIALVLSLLILSGCDELIQGAIMDVDGELRVHFIDVGQGDATLIQQINKDSIHNMLIDAGNNGDGKKLVDYLKSQGVDSLNYIIGTHPHSDHIGGMDDIINSFDIGVILMPKVTSNTRTFEEVMEAIQSKGLRITTPIPGTKYQLGDAEFTILAPNKAQYSNLNNYSIGNRLVYGENSFIFTGDAEGEAEKEILDKFSKRELKSDVLKMGHHGSSSSNIDEFIDAVKPEYGVISCGLDNIYGHPHREIIDMTKRENLSIFRTDYQGTIIMTSDGVNISVDTERVSNRDQYTDDISISTLDKVAEMVTISNVGEEDINLLDWKLVSVRGNQEFIFPNYILKSDSIVTVGGYDARNEVDFIWEIGGGVWSNSLSDPAELYDKDGNLISVFMD